MGRWLDRWAKRAAEAAPSAASEPTPPAQPAPRSPSPSRRDFLKKAGVVGGVAWSVPVLQTVMAPAASASPGSTKGSPCTGGVNDNGLVCGDGSRCFNGVCGAPGAFCDPNTGTAQCVSSECDGGRCGGLGAKCNQGKVCAPGFVCGTGNKCQAA